jgi:hypothetical protein
MGEKAESEEFEGEELDEPAAEEAEADVDLDQVTKDLDLAKKRALKSGEPPWRRLERLREDKLTAELTSDFADYDIGDGTRKSGRKARR